HRGVQELVGIGVFSGGEALFQGGEQLLRRPFEEVGFSPRRRDVASGEEGNAEQRRKKIGRVRSRERSGGRESVEQDDVSLKEARRDLRVPAAVRPVEAVEREDVLPRELRSREGEAVENGERRREAREAEGDEPREPGIGEIGPPGEEAR